VSTAYFFEPPCTCNIIVFQYNSSPVSIFDADVAGSFRTVLVIRGVVLTRQN